MMYRPVKLSAIFTTPGGSRRANKSHLIIIVINKHKTINTQI